MVYKEEVYNWFHCLTGSSRIDFLCGLLLKCGPFELRYLGACIEDLARKEYNNLREDENNANKAAYVRQLNSIFEPCIRSKLTLSLALLYSANRECSDIVYRTLESQLQVAHLEPHFTNILSDDQIYEEFLLLLTMTVHHPAFAFHQKHSLKSYLDRLIRLREIQRQGCCKASSCSDTVEDEEEGGIGLPEMSQLSTPTIPVATPTSPVIPNGEPGPQPVYIKDIEVKDLKRRPSDKRYEYIFQITWSNGVVNTVGKTHGELFAFQCRILNQLPEVGSHQSDCNMPYLPAKQSSQMAHKGELEKVLPQVKEYARQLVALPRRILQCEEMLNFFQYQETSTPQNMPQQAVRMPAPTSTTISSQKIQEELIKIDIFTSFPRSACSNVSGTAVSKPVIHKVSTSTTTNRPTYTQGMSNQPLAISPLPSPLSSPHISPSVSPSSMSSPRQLMHSPSGFVGPQEPSGVFVQEWLKGLRLHKYSNHFQEFNFKQLMQLTMEDLDKWQGITDGAKKKLMTHIEQLRVLYGKRCVNGVTERTILTEALQLLSPPHNRSYSSSSHISVSPQQPPVQSLFATPQFMHHNTNPSGDYSSSDSSSTPSSPRESSDENEKDSEASESSSFSIPESNLSRRSVMKDEKSGRVHPSNMTSCGSSRSQSMQDLPARSRQLNVSTKTSSHPAVMPTYSNVVKSRSMERIGSQDSKQQSPGGTHSHCHSTPSSPASEMSLRQIQQQTAMPIHSIQQLPGGDGQSRQHTQVNTSINATSPLRSSAMVFTPKLSSNPSGINQSDVSTCTTTVSSQHVIKSPGITASMENSTVTTYKTSMAYVPNQTTNAMSVVTSVVPALPPLISTPAVPSIKPESVVSSPAIPITIVHSTHTVCLTSSASAKVETIYTTAKTLATVAHTNVTYTTAPPRGGNEGTGVNSLQPPATVVAPSVGHNPSVSLQPSNTYSTAEHGVTSHNNIPLNYGNGGNQGNNYHGNHVVNFPHNGNNFGGNRGPGANFNNTGNNGNACNSANNSMVCTSCGSPCATNNPLNNNTAAAFQFPPNPGYTATHMPNALQHANFPGFLHPNINGLISPGIPGTHRYAPRVPHSPFQNGIGDFWIGNAGNLGMLPQGVPLPLGLFAHPGNPTHHIVGHKKVTCYNCGGVGHRANECKEFTMEALQSKFNLKYTPVTESEPE
ncbi:uncharacterized protein LOC144437332 [Glandiceps talaboti]